MPRINPAFALAAPFMLAVGLTGLTQRANAAEFATTTTAQQLSITRGFAAAALAVQQRTAGAGASAVGNTLVNAVCGHTCPRAVAIGKATSRLTGNGWMLEISADGSSARFDNTAVTRQAPALAKDVAQSIAAETLANAGRAYIASTLHSAIVLAPQEQLVPVRTDYLVFRGEDLQTHKIARSVILNRIVFGRRIGGVPVVGGGSTVVLTFANNGALASFRYDWPQYHAAQAPSQALLKVPQIVARINSVIAARHVDARVPSSARQVSARSTHATVAGKPGIALQKLECGYFDPGAAAGTVRSTVQPGCVYHAVERDSDGLRQGLAGAVPAGAAFIPQAGWRESTILRVLR